MSEGSAIVFGDDVNTDLLHPSYFFSLDNTRVRDGFWEQWIPPPTATSIVHASSLPARTSAVARRERRP